MGDSLAIDIYTGKIVELNEIPLFRTQFKTCPFAGRECSGGKDYCLDDKWKGGDCYDALDNKLKEIAEVGN